MKVQVDGLTFVMTDAFTGRQSSIKEYLDCHRLYGWQRVENLTPDRPSWPLEFGSATHSYLLERGRGASGPEATDIGLQRLLRDWPQPMFPGEEEALYEHRELALRLWPAYSAYYASDDAQMIPLGQEVKGRVEVGTGTNVFLVFQLDKIVNYLNRLWVADYKTMAKNDDRNFLSYEVDMQPTAYVYGASKVLNTRVAGVIIDGLIKTKVPQFRREQYIRSDEELVEFEREFVEVCKEIAWRHTRVSNGENWKTVFFKNTRQCFRYYECKFRPLCVKDTPMQRMAYAQRTPDYMDDPSLLAGASPERTTP